MKKFVRIIAAVLVAIMALSLVACGSTFGRIKSDFEKNGYAYVTDEEGNSIFDAYVAELEEGEITCTLHVFKAEPKEQETDGGILGAIGNALGSLVNAVDYCGVIEFGSNAEMVESIEQNESLRALIGDVSTSKLVNGNYVLITGIVNIDEKIEIFSASK